MKKEYYIRMAKDLFPEASYEDLAGYTVTLLKRLIANAYAGEDTLPQTAPMLCTDSRDVFWKNNPLEEKLMEDALWCNKDYILEEKIDEARILLHICEDGRIRITTRGVDKRTQLHREVSHLFSFDPLPYWGGHVFDGGLKILGAPRTACAGFLNMCSSEEAARRYPNRQIFIYDLWQQGSCSAPYEHRCRTVDRFTQTEWALKHHVFKPRSYWAPDMAGRKDFYRDIIAGGGEGVIFKHKGGLYEPGERVRNQWKLKPLKEMDVYVALVMQGKENGRCADTCGSICISFYPGGPQVGAVSNFCDADRASLWARRYDLLGRRMNITYESIIDGAIMQARFLRWRDTVD